MAKIFRKRGNARTIQDLYRDDLRTEGQNWSFNTKNAVELIRRAAEQKQTVTILGDYDADGVCASAILYQTLRTLGLKARVRLPLRFSEGYGMNRTMVDEIDSGLVITVDNGITALEEVRDAKGKGLTVIVTDHHLPVLDENGMPVLPEADCVIDPHCEEISGQAGYDFYDYCGAGVALKLAESLTDDVRVLSRCRALAAIATVADVMPMLGENRSIYRNGMEAVILENVSAGILNLLDLCGISLRDRPESMKAYNFISQDKISFKLGPIINAPSRMIEKAEEYGYPFIKEGGDGAKLSFVCLTAEKREQASEVAASMTAINDLRKKEANLLADAAYKEISSGGMEDHCPLVVFLPDAKQGLVGIIAGKLCEEFGRPAVVLSRMEDGICPGSCRSIEGVNIRMLLDQVADLLETYGGHEGAAGVTLREENIPEFRIRLQQAFEDCYGPYQAVENIPAYDLEIDAAEIPQILEYMQEYLTPFGPGNPEPVFLIRNFVLKDIQNLRGRHVKFSDGRTEAMLFNTDAGSVIRQFKYEDRMYFLGTLSYNCFRGRATPQINMTDFGLEGEVSENNC